MKILNQAMKKLRDGESFSQEEISEVVQLCNRLVNLASKQKKIIEQNTQYTGEILRTNKKVTRLKSGGHIYPRIELSGQPLIEMGFEYGDDISVEYRKETNEIFVKKYQPGF